MWKYRRKVKYYETDRMGVVHHSNYLRFLEDARMDWICDNIISYSDIEKMGIIIPAVSASGNFRTPLRYDDSFVVFVQPILYSGVRIGFKYEIYNEKTNELCYDGETLHCFTVEEDSLNRIYRPVSIKTKFPDLHEKFLKSTKQEQNK